MAAAAPILTGGKDQAGETAAQRSAVYQAAHTWGVNADVLWAIYGAESTFGRGGHNWFGLVNVPRTGNFAGDANASARTLRALLDANGGNYEAALRSYSGGSYGVLHLVDVLKADPTKVAFPKTGGKWDKNVFPAGAFLDRTGTGTPLDAPGAAALAGANAVGSVGAAASAVGGAASDVGGAIATAWNTLTAPKTWLRVLYFIGGIALGYFALRQLSAAQGGS